MANHRKDEDLTIITKPNNTLGVRDRAQALRNDTIQWTVHNATNPPQPLSNITFGNFSPSNPFDHITPIANLLPRQTKAIKAHVDPNADPLIHVYSFTVFVNGTATVDPELELQDTLVKKKKRPVSKKKPAPKKKMVRRK